MIVRAHCRMEQEWIKVRNQRMMRDREEKQKKLAAGSAAADASLAPEANRAEMIASPSSPKESGEAGGIDKEEEEELTQPQTLPAGTESSSESAEKEGQCGAIVSPISSSGGEKAADDVCSEEEVGEELTQKVLAGKAISWKLRRHANEESLRSPPHEEDGGGGATGGVEQPTPDGQAEDSDSDDELLGIGIVKWQQEKQRGAGRSSVGVGDVFGTPTVNAAKKGDGSSERRGSTKRGRVMAEAGVVALEEDGRGRCGTTKRAKTLSLAAVFK
jgi:hypothetical protein